jgi:hypothetical protein
VFESVQDYTTNKILQKNPTQRIENVENIGLIVTQIITADLEKVGPAISNNTSTAAPGYEPHRAPISFETKTLDQTIDSQTEKLAHKTATSTQSLHENIIITDATVHETEQNFERPSETVQMSAISSFETFKSVAQSEIFSVESSQKLSDGLTQVESFVQSSIDNDTNKFYVTEEVQPSESTSESQIRAPEPSGTAKCVPFEHNQVVIEKVQAQEKEGQLTEFLVQSQKSANLNIETFESIGKSEIVTADTFELLSEKKVMGQESQVDNNLKTLCAPTVAEVISTETTEVCKTDFSKVSSATSNIEFLQIANVTEVQPQETVPHDTISENQSKQIASIVLDTMKTSISALQVRTNENIADLTEIKMKGETATKTFSKVNESIQHYDVQTNEKEQQFSDSAMPTSQTAAKEIGLLNTLTQYEPLVSDNFVEMTHEETVQKNATPNIRGDLFATASVLQPQTHEHEQPSSDVIHLDLQHAESNVKTLKLPLRTEVVLSEDLSDLNLLQQPLLTVAMSSQASNLILAENTEIIPGENTSILQEKLPKKSIFEKIQLVEQNTSSITETVPCESLGNLVKEQEIQLQKGELQFQKINVPQKTETLPHDSYVPTQDQPSRNEFATPIADVNLYSLQNEEITEYESEYNIQEDNPTQLKPKSSIQEFHKVPKTIQTFLEENTGNLSHENLQKMQTIQTFQTDNATETIDTHYQVSQYSMENMQKVYLTENDKGR